MPRKVSVFSYGSFMDAGILAQAGYHPEHIAVAHLNGFDIVARPLATLVPRPDQVVYGILAGATHDELRQLYGQDWVRAYLNEAVIRRFVT